VGVPARDRGVEGARLRARVVGAADALLRAGARLRGPPQAARVPGARRRQRGVAARDLLRLRLAAAAVRDRHGRRGVGRAALRAPRDAAHARGLAGCSRRGSGRWSRAGCGARSGAPRARPARRICSGNTG
jgi:hypothetical protein